MTQNIFRIMKNYFSVITGSRDKCFHVRSIIYTRAHTHTHTHQHQTMEAADTELLSRSQLWLILLMKRSQEETAATTEATKQIQKPKPSTPRQMDGISRKVSLTLLLWRQRNKLSRCSQVFADDRLLLLHRRDVASLPRRYWREESLQQSATEERHAWNVDSKPGAWVSLPLWLHCLSTVSVMDVDLWSESDGFWCCLCGLLVN